jgi:hypothetical protein
VSSLDITAPDLTTLSVGELFVFGDAPFGRDRGCGPLDPAAPLGRMRPLTPDGWTFGEILLIFQAVLGSISAFAFCKNLEFRTNGAKRPAVTKHVSKVGVAETKACGVPFQPFAGACAR